MKELQELHKRIARRNFEMFVRYIKPELDLCFAHEAICNTLNTLQDEGSQRIIVNLPPRFGKSELVSRCLPAFLLATDPDTEIILASYSARLAKKMLKDVKRILQSNEFKELFGDILPRANDRTRVDQADLLQCATGKGQILAVGVRGSATGSGAHVVIIDDPIKDRQEADSLTMQSNIWEWYTSVILTRLSKDPDRLGSVVLCQTRWNRNDLTGKVIEADGAAAWNRLVFRAIAEEGDQDKHTTDQRPTGEGIHPARRFDAATLRLVERAIGAKDFAALYQQRPLIAGGNIFSVNEFLYGTPESIGRTYISCDYAFKGKNTSDYTAFSVWTVVGKHKYMIDFICEKIGFMSALSKTKELLNTYKNSVLIVETKANGDAIVDALRKEGVYNIREVSPDADKVTRVHRTLHCYRDGSVVFCPALKSSKFLEQFEYFPSYANDDLVDSVTQFLLEIDRISMFKNL